MTDATKFTVNTAFGTLVGVFTSETGLRVFTEFDTYEYVAGGRVEHPGGRLVLRGVQYTVDAYLHPIGACVKRDLGFGGGTWCPDTHTTGWALGAIANPAYDHGRRSKPGELEQSTMYATIRRADGRDATWRNRDVLSAEIVRAANVLTRTAAAGPEQARIRNLQAEYVKADATARKLSAETDAAFADLLRLSKELTALGALPDLAAAA